MSDVTSPSGSVDPIFISVKQMAQMLGLSTWVAYQLLDEQKIESRYHGRRRLVLVSSVRNFADNLSAYPMASGE